MGKLSKSILHILGWKITDPYPPFPKSVCIMAPHTSMYDFVIGKLYFNAIGIKPRFLIKQEVFWWPLGSILKALGGIPVNRSKPAGLTEQILDYFEQSSHCTLIITPEATRKKVKRWKTGALRIARRAGVPLVLGRVDYEKKELGIVTVYEQLSGDPHFINSIKKDFAHIKGKHPEKFDPYYEQ